MRHLLATAVGKVVRAITSARGGGSAAPGLVAEKIDPRYLTTALAEVPGGVVVVSGTNGKTTTTKMLVQLLESQGLRVFTNRSGSNFTRGVAASVLGEPGFSGKVNADVAVLELDEAHASHFVKLVRPEISLLLNVMRDQLDRFGEIEHTARLLGVIAEATTETLVLNREDPRIARLASVFPGETVSFYGLSEQLRSKFPSDDEMRGGAGAASIGSSAAGQEADVTLEAMSATGASYQIAGTDYTTELAINGLYNMFNAAAALACARQVLQRIAPDQRNAAQDAALIQSLSHVQPAFGRGESFTVAGQPLQLVLVKNPAGFRLALNSFEAKGYATMIAINDNYADGRDMSWLWDVDFDSLADAGVSVVSGVRAADMALRLKYDDVVPGQVLPDVSEALDEFIRHNKGVPKRIYTTYTAMLALRKELAKYTEVSAIS